MSSLIVRIAAILIGLLCLFLSIQSPALLVGAAFFLGLAALSIWGRSEAHIFLAGALVAGVHPVLGVLTGKIAAIGRHASRDILLAKEPSAFWITVTIYCAMTLASLLAAYYFWRKRRAAPVSSNSGTSAF